MRDAGGEGRVRGGDVDGVDLVRAQLNFGGEQSVAVGAGKHGEASAGDHDAAIGPRDAGDDNGAAIGGDDGNIERRRGVGIGQCAATEDGVLQQENVVGVDDAVFVEVGKGEEIGDEVELVLTGGEMVEELLEVDDGGFRVGIEIAQQRGRLGRDTNCG